MGIHWRNGWLSALTGSRTAIQLSDWETGREAVKQRQTGPASERDGDNGISGFSSSTELFQYVVGWVDLSSSIRMSDCHVIEWMDGATAAAAPGIGKRTTVGERAAALWAGSLPPSVSIVWLTVIDSFPIRIVNGCCLMFNNQTQ